MVRRNVKVGDRVRIKSCRGSAGKIGVVTEADEKFDLYLIDLRTSGGSERTAATRDDFVIPRKG